MSDDKPALPIQIDKDTQAMVARDNSELIRMIRTFMKGASFPKTLDTEEKIISCWQVAASLKVPPIIAIQNMAVIHGSVAIWGQLPKALAEATGELEDYVLYYIDKEYNKLCVANKNLHVEAYAAVVEIKRKGRTRNEYTFSLDDAKLAGLTNKQGPWKEHRKVMMARRASGWGIKVEFPDALMGTAIAEYDLHEAPDLKDVTPLRAERTNTANEFLEAMNGPTTAGVSTGDTFEGSENLSRPVGFESGDVQAPGDELQNVVVQDERRVNNVRGSRARDRSN